MIAYLKGTVLEKGRDSLVLEVNGIGYDICVAAGTLRAVEGEGRPLELFISETTGLYGGGTTLYGFLTREEKDIFLCLREVPSTGAKKALEHLDKASRSLPDFRRAILESDSRMLADVFGFTKKTAERLIAALKDKLLDAARAGTPDSRSHGHPLSGSSAASTRVMHQALEALLHLGYKPAQCRDTIQALALELQGKEPSAEDMIRMALKRL